MWQGGVKCVVTVRWLYPRILFSEWDMGEGGSFWPRCFSPSSVGQMCFLVCTDCAPDACRHSGLGNASPESAAAVGAAWSGSPCRDCVSSQSVRAWWCLHIPMASGASERNDQYIQLAQCIMNTPLEE